MDERVAERDDRAFAGEPELGVVPLIPLLGDGEQVLAARLDESHRPAERPGQERNQDVLGVDDGLGAEAAADVLRDDADGVLGQLQITREQPAKNLRCLRRRPHGDLAEVGVPARHDPARLHRHPGAPVQREPFAQHEVGSRQRARGVADPLGEARGHVAAGMNAWRVGPERVGHGDGGQGLVLDRELREGVFSELGALGHHESHGLTGVRDDLSRQDFGTRGCDQALVRHEQRQPAELNDIVPNDDVDDATMLPRAVGVDPREARVGVRAAVDRHVEHSRQRYVGDVPPAAGSEPLVLAAAHAGAE